MLDTQLETPTTVQLPDSKPRGAWIAVLFAFTSLLGAALLFMVQPLAAKLILPSFGGSATVWSTSSLFFQVLLLLGYVYAHISSRRLGAWWQPRLHVLVLIVPLLFLPVALPVDAAPTADASPTLWLLRTLTLMVGVPFLVLSSTGPLIQRWYSWSRGPRADDPYFLFAGSNLGSFLGLLCYPFVIEPMLTLTQQRWTWTIALGVFLALMTTCAMVVRAPRSSAEHRVTTALRSRGPAASQVVTWCALAFLPSCLMLAVTAHISTDVAPIPLLWVLPLAVYLASFIAAFARRTRQPPAGMTRAAVVSAVLSGVISLVGPAIPIWAVVAVDLTTVGLVSYAAHARLAATRPDTENLTGFYLVISVGGALGGLVNGVVAPMLFNRVWEYGLSLAAVPLLMSGLLTQRSTWFTLRYHAVFRIAAGALLIPIAMLAAAAGLGVAAPLGTLAIAPVLALIAAGAWKIARQPAALALCLLLGTAALGIQAVATSIDLQRTFYGSYRVVDESGVHKLIHGTTVHGIQFQDDARRGRPTAYYAADGPLGAVMQTVDHTRMAVVGLGAGAIGAYGTAGDHYTFFEIDPAVETIAEHQGWFTFLEDSDADADVVVGDGRLKLAEQPAEEFDVIVLDAFSSDSIPVHLLTQEAFKEYASRLAPGGSLVIHISNRIFDLAPVLTAHAQELGWKGVRGVGAGASGADQVASDWVVITPDPVTADTLLAQARWSKLDSRDPVTWTDNYASVLSVLR